MTTTRHVMRAANYRTTEAQAVEAIKANGKALTSIAIAASAGPVPPPPDLNAAIRAAQEATGEDYRIDLPPVRIAVSGVPEPPDMNAAIRAASKLEDFKARVRSFLSGGR